MWYKWQSLDPPTRISKISGKVAHNVTEEILLDSMIAMGDLAPSVTRRQMLDTLGSGLCYIY